MRTRRGQHQDRGVRLGHDLGDATGTVPIVKEGVRCTSIEARSMIAGAVALGVYSHLVMEVMAHRKRSALFVSMSLLSVWFAVAFGLYVAVFR